ncbi:phosphotransferase family protein [Nocardioides humi]|uniref:Phosphotransferase family protein n=1 Tax=Nocardioides humi TaxID=449461 RepID=A0ABN2AHG4_9ACTN|nr:phosphotransferase family protein [Nocardioides humi]
MATDPAANRRLLAALRPWLLEQGADPDDVVVDHVSTPTSGGFSNGTWLFRVQWPDGSVHESRELVLRTPPAGPTFLHLPTLDLQGEVMAALGDSAVPVPRVLWRGREEDDTPYLLMGRVAGRPPADSPPYTEGGWILDLPPGARRRLHDAAVEAMAAVHAVDLAAVEIPSLERPEPGRTALDLRLAFYEAYYDYVARELGSAHVHVERGLAWLRDNRPAEEEDAVLNWGDSRFGNLIFEPGGTEVAALLDWEFACVASPAHDVAHWMFADRYFTEGIGVPRPEGFPTGAEQLDHYRALTGRALDDLPYYEVALATQSAINVMRVAQVSIAAGWMPAAPGAGIETGSTLILRRLLGDRVEGAATHFAKS